MQDQVEELQDGIGSGRILLQVIFNDGGVGGLVGDGDLADEIGKGCDIVQEDAENGVTVSYVGALDHCNIISIIIGYYLKINV